MLRRRSSLVPIVVLAVACSSSNGTQQCSAKYDCPSGQTCWSTDGKSFACMPAGPGQVNASCVASPGPAPCGDHLACVAIGATNQGQCQYWCDASDPCPAGSGSCDIVTTTNGVTLGFCPASVGDGGSPACNVSYDCPAGETCWTTDGFRFSCMKSGPAKAGSTCAPIYGSPSCGDRLACAVLGATNEGQCVYWCDPNDPCPSGSGSCQMRTDSNGVTIGFCQ